MHVEIQFFGFARVGKSGPPRFLRALPPPCQSQIFTVLSLDIVVDEDVQFVQNLPSCECESSDFWDLHHQHVIIGDLPIVSHQKLHKPLTKGPNYREAKTLNYNKCKKEIAASLEETINGLAAKYSVNKSDFVAWKQKVD